jgi:NAD(P)H-hydrate epimerase
MITRIRPLCRTEIRQLDVRAAEALGLPTSLLMENAGRGAAAWLAELCGAMPPDAGGRPLSPDLAKHIPDLPRGPALPKVVVLCGPGNNGGDGAVLARHLDGWRFPVRVVWFAQSNRLSGDAATQWAILQKSGIQQAAWLDERAGEPKLDNAWLAGILAGADWIVDGLLGTGLSRPVEGLLRTVIDAMNAAGKPILALDLPSGLDADTGVPLGAAVRGVATATFAAPKLGFSASGAVAYTGQVAVIDIGLPRCLLEPFYAS